MRTYDPDVGLGSWTKRTELRTVRGAEFVGPQLREQGRGYPSAIILSYLTSKMSQAEQATGKKDVGFYAVEIFPCC